jgi:hypothetical protein
MEKATSERPCERNLLQEEGPPSVWGAGNLGAERGYIERQNMYGVSWETGLRCSAKGGVAGNGQNEDSPLGYYERQPDLVIKSFHSPFSTPQKPFQCPNGCIITKASLLTQGKFAVAGLSSCFQDSYDLVGIILPVLLRGDLPDGAHRDHRHSGPEFACRPPSTTRQEIHRACVRHRRLQMGRLPLGEEQKLAAGLGPGQSAAILGRVGVGSENSAVAGRQVPEDAR